MFCGEGVGVGVFVVAGVFVGVGVVGGVVVGTGPVGVGVVLVLGVGVGVWIAVGLFFFFDGFFCVRFGFFVVCCLIVCFFLAFLICWLSVCVSAVAVVRSVGLLLMAFVTFVMVVLEDDVVVFG